MDSYDDAQVPHFDSSVFVAEIDGTKARTLRTFYPRIAKIMHFPDYFGKNLDALFDCLTSLETIGRQDVVLLIRNFSLFLDKEKPDKKAAALKVLQDAEIPENRYDTVRFRVIVVE